MRNTLFLLFITTAIVLSSCSKEARINRKLDGEWNATQVNGVVPPAGSAVTFSFSRDKKGKGTGSQTASYGGFSISTPFTYSISGEVMMKKNDADNSVDEYYTIREHTKKRFVFASYDDKETILVAK